MKKLRLKTGDPVWVAATVIVFDDTSTVNVKIGDRIMWVFTREIKRRSR